MQFADQVGHCRGLTAGHFLGIAALVGGSVVGISEQWPMASSFSDYVFVVFVDY
jgi:hypothetical protein